MKQLLKWKTSEMAKWERWERFGYLRSASGIMYWTGNEDSSLPINHNGPPIVGDSTLDKLKPQEANQAQEQAQLGNWVGFHVLPFLSVSLSTQMVDRTQSREWIVKYTERERARAAKSVVKQQDQQQQGPFTLVSTLTGLRLWTELYNICIYINLVTE